MQLSDVSDGVHKCDHTRDAGRKQLDDGVNHTFVSAPVGVRRSVLENRYQSTIDMHLRGGSSFSGS